MNEEEDYGYASDKNIGSNKRGESFDKDVNSPLLEVVNRGANSVNSHGFYNPDDFSQYKRYGDLQTKG